MCIRDRYSLDTDEETGMIDYRLDKPATGDVALLMDSMILGLKGIQDVYKRQLQRIYTSFLTRRAIHLSFVLISHPLLQEVRLSTI